MCAQHGPEYEKFLKPSELIETLETVLGELDGKMTPSIQPLRHFMEIQRGVTPNGHYLCMPAQIPSLKCFGIKLVIFYPCNKGTSIPAHHSTIMLYDSVTGQLLTQMDARPITLHRTAAVSAIALKLFMPNEGTGLVLAMIGSGNQAKSHIQYLTTVAKDLKEIRVWSRNADNVHNCISIVQEEYDIKTPLVASKSAEEACRGADIIVTVTLATEPVVKGSWLKEGAIVIGVGAVRAKWRELDDEVMRNSVVFTDNLEAAKAESGDIILSDSRDRIKCDISHLINERKADWREGNKFIVFKSLGMAAEDVIAAHMVYTKYLRK